MCGRVCARARVFSSVMFLACQCNGARVVSRAFCPLLAFRMRVLIDRQVQLECMCSTCMFLLVCLYTCAPGCLCVHMLIGRVWYVILQPCVYT